MKKLRDIISLKKALPFVVSLIILFTIVFIIFNIPKKMKEKEVDLTVLTTNLSVAPYANSLLRLKETGDIYYQAKDGKRYVFVAPEVFNSWFTDKVEIPEQTIKEMEQSPLGGQMSVRPGTLITTDTDPNIYIALGGKSIKKISEQQIQQYYGENFAPYKVDLANYYFTAYTMIGDLEIDDIKTIAGNQLLENCLITH